jgi:ferredoxin
MCPDVFELRTDGFLYILNENPPTELHESVIAAEEICPTGAITIEQ